MGETLHVVNLNSKSKKSMQEREIVVVRDGVLTERRSGACFSLSDEGLSLALEHEQPFFVATSCCNLYHELGMLYVPFHCPCVFALHHLPLFVPISVCVQDSNYFFIFVVFFGTSS